MNRRNLWLRRKSVRFRFAEDQEKRVSAAYACLRWIVNLGVFITVLAQLLDALCCAGAQIIKSTKDNRFGWANFRACGYEPALLAIITKRALERAAGVRQWLRTTINYAERTRNDAITAAIANIVLHQHGTDFGAHNRAGRTRFEATGFFAMLADSRKEKPTETGLPRCRLLNMNQRSGLLFVGPVQQTSRDAT